MVYHTAKNVHKKSIPLHSLRGAHLLAMLANTEVAKEVRKWLLDLADKEIGIIDTITTEQKYSIKKAVNERAYRTGEHHQTIYHKLYDHFKINSYESLPASKFDEAIKFLGGISSQSKLSDNELYTLARLVFVANYMREKIQLIEPALKLIDSSYRGSFYSMGVEFKHEIEEARLIIMRETNHITTNHFTANWNRVLPVIRNKTQNLSNQF